MNNNIRTWRHYRSEELATPEEIKQRNISAFWALAIIALVIVLKSNY